MKKLFNCKIALLALICLFVSAASAQINPTKKEAKEWADKGEWRNGFKRKLFAGTDYVEFYKQYHKNKDNWDKAFTYLANTGMLDTLSTGKHLIAGEDVFSNVTDGQTKEYDKTSWEDHHTYVDIHLLIRGKERIGVMNPATATITTPYNEAKDVANYDVNTKGDYYVADADNVLILFPQNAHRPSIHVDGYDKVKKVVIKIKMAQ